MKSFEDEIRIDVGAVPSYGGSGYSWIRVTCRNRLLEYKKCSGDFELGKTFVLMEQKWKKKWTEAKLKAELKDKKLASDWCCHCKGHTLDGQISCVDKVFCLKCEPEIENYIAAYHNK